MSRLIVHVEGVTEEDFVNAVLAPHLLMHGWEKVAACRIGRARSRAKRHGIKGWDVTSAGIIRHLKEDAGCCVTTCVDYYGMPQTGEKAWPGRAEADLLQFYQKAATIEDALRHDLSQAMGKSFNPNRFIPFVMMHEFEGLLFSDCDRFGKSIGMLELIAHFQAIRDQFNTPEEINDSPQTAPSKRISALLANYDKPLMGTLAALEIGIDTIRKECPHFNQWLTRLEAWPH
ncbi:MAG: DUF4276 family protein [Desulfuromonadales bacterium]